MSWRPRISKDRASLSRAYRDAPERKATAQLRTPAGSSPSTRSQAATSTIAITASSGAIRRGAAGFGPKADCGHVFPSLPQNPARAACRSMNDQAETHPGAIVDVSEREIGWRMGVANAWRVAEHKQTADECRAAIAALGNAGPQAELIT